MISSWPSWWSVSVAITLCCGVLKKSIMPLYYNVFIIALRWAQTVTWQWAGRRPGAGLPRLLPRAGRLLQRWCGPAETWRQCACRLCCGFPGATYLRAKIQHFITSAKCLGVFRSATPKRPAPAAPSAARGASAPRRRPHCPPAEPAAAVCKVFAQCAASGPTAWRPTHCETGHSAAQNSPLRPAIQAVWPT